MPNTDMMNIHHKNYTDTIEEVRLVRDSIEGSNAIKNGPRADIYLPNPTDSKLLRGQDLTASTERYKKYKDRAEYDQFPGRTESGYMGTLKSTPPVLEEIPVEIEYLINNSDGANLSLLESIEITQANLLEVKYHGLLVDFNGINQSNEEGEHKQLTTGEAKALGLSADIKHYQRESILDWLYEVVNNRMQLSYVKLAEKATKIDRETLEHIEVENQLVLALDEDTGKYYQQYITKDKNGEDHLSEKRFPENRDGRLDFITFEIVIEQKQKSASIPKGLGILYPICLKALDRYHVKADLKEAMHKSAQPTLKTSGWSEQSADLFKKMNGSDVIMTGAGGGIPLPDGVTAEYLQWEADNNAMFKYLEINQKEAKALGARFDTSDPKDEAVGVAKIRSAEELSALINIQEAIKESYTRVMTWCFLFMSTVTDDPFIKINLNKEFNKVKLTAQEVKEIRENVINVIFDKEEGLRQLERGGILTQEAEIILNRLEIIMQ